MAFDPAQEEYRRLSLRFARTQDLHDPFAVTRAASAFRRCFAWNHDSLPQTDRDRAFHLVARSSQIVDSDLPFADERDVAALVYEAHGLLEEALALDPDCHDARRMLAAQDCTAFEDYYRFLVDGLDEVRAKSLAQRDAIIAKNEPGCRAEARLGMFPLYRWLAALAARALVCGRYRKALAAAEELLALDPADHGDVRFTAALAYAKLEDEEGLRALLERCSHSVQGRLRPDAWSLLAQCGLALKAGRDDEARAHLHKILDVYPHAGSVLAAQGEVPDGIFARLAVEPYSNDELVLAVSEATVLTQEGLDLQGIGALGSFIAKDAEVIHGAMQDELEVAAVQGALSGRS